MEMDIFGYNNNKIIKYITIDFKQWCSKIVNALRWILYYYYAFKFYKYQKYKRA